MDIASLIIKKDELLKSVEQGNPGEQLELNVTDGHFICTIDHNEKGDKK